jgi:hypothetical protein
MANKRIDKDRIIELALKQPKEDQLYIINGIVKGLSEDNANAKLENEVEKLKVELNLYRSNSSKLVKDYVNKELKNPTEDK